MAMSRRLFLGTAASSMAVVGSMSTVVGAAGRNTRISGYGPLIPDPDGYLDLPEGFRYVKMSMEGETLTGGAPVPSSHDGMACFGGRHGARMLVRNHELSPDDLIEDGLTGVEHVAGMTYDPDAPGGTTTLKVTTTRELVTHTVSLAGTLNNCAGGKTPWNTWLTCEEDTSTLSKPHGYVFEVDPYRGGNPEPITAMGRMEHEAVAFDPRGDAYLTEDADSPFGAFYRFSPARPHRGAGSLHAGGVLMAMKVHGVEGDLSIVQDPGSVFDVEWLEIPEVDPGDDATSVRQQSLELGGTPIQKCEGTWADPDGSIWFVGSRGDGPDAEDEEDRSAAEHAGQIWRYDPWKKTIELVVIFPKGTPYDEPDNITVSPHGYALACTDGDDDQWLVGITPSGDVFPFGFNALNSEEFAGATFSSDGQTLFVNTQGPPGITYAIWGPWWQKFAGI